MSNLRRDYDFPLDPFQRQAAEYVPGPAVVEGGSGTGKTHVLVARVATLADWGVSPAEIACLTAGGSAATEFRRQLMERDLIKDDLDNIFVGTVDHAANLLLRLSGAIELGLSPHYSIWDERRAKDAASLTIVGTGLEETLKPKLGAALHWNRNRKQRSVDDPDLPAEDPTGLTSYKLTNATSSNNGPLILGTWQSLRSDC